MRNSDNRRITIWVAGLILIIAAVVTITFLYTAHVQRSIIAHHQLTNRLYHNWLLFKESVYTGENPVEERADSREIYRRLDSLIRDVRNEGSYRTADPSASRREQIFGTVDLQWQALSPRMEELTGPTRGETGGELEELLRSPLIRSFERNLAVLDRLTFSRTGDQLRRLRIMSYAVLIVMAFFIIGFLFFLFAGRQRLHGEHRVRLLTQSLLKRLEEERKQVSFDLHDVLFQDLASVKMKCQNLLEDLREGSTVDSTRLETVVDELQELIRGTRGITRPMKPKRLEHFGLAGGIKALCNDLSTHSSLDVRFFAVGLEAVEIEFDTEITLYRIAQEFLRHVRLYSEAERISVRLIASSPKLYLRISDDGIGINPFKQRRTSRTSPDEQLRLIAIEERVRMLEGDFTVDSQPGEGTEYKVGIPLRQGGASSEPAATG